VARRHSLRWRLPILVSALVAVLLAIFLWTVYRELRRELVETAGERAQFAADQVGELLGTATRQRLAELRAAGDSAAVRQHLAAPSAQRLPAVEAALGALVTSADHAASLVTATGRLIASVGSSAAAVPVARPQPGVSLRAAGDRVVAEFVDAVRGAAGDAPIGYVIAHRPLGSAATADVLGRMMGASAYVIVGLPGSGVWTDFVTAVPRPPRLTRGSASHVSASGERRLGALSAIADVPWLVWVEFSEGVVLAPARESLTNMTVLALLLVGLAAAGSTVLGSRITRPLADLTAASETIAAGDYTLLPPVGGRDEVGRLGRAFAVMTGRVHDAHQRLEARVRERTQALRALQESEAKHRATIDVALDAIVGIDARGLVTEFNPAAEQIFGYSREEAMGRDMAELIVPPQYRALHRNGLAHFLATGQGRVVGRRTELVGMRKDGTHLPVELAIQSLTLDQQPVFIAYIRDITARRRAEAARLRSVELDAENRRVREASRLKSEFLANMSHELRTPLNSIIGFSTILHEGQIQVTPEERTEFLGHIRTSGEHLLQLINDVLDLSKIEAGKVRFHPEAVDLSALVAGVVEAMSGMALSKRIVVRADVPPELSDATLDASRFRQVLYNFLSNALKFTPEGGRVTVRIEPDETALMFRLEVEDTGIGIAEEDRVRLFTEFEQLDAGVAKHYGGTGLGLALTKRLVEAQGGQVGVRSRLGAGSVFHAVLPRHQTKAATPDPPAQTVPQGGGPTILVVEDDPADRHLLVETLMRSGYRVLAAERASDALAIGAEHFLDAVTLDLILPDQSGLELLQELRRTSRNPDVPVVVVTVVAEKAALAGHVVADVLPKPIDADALLASLRRVIPSSGRHRVMVVDDDEASCRLAGLAVAEAGGEVDIYHSPLDALSAASASPPSAIVLDLLMPELSGFEFLTRLRADPANRSTPVIVWTVKDLLPDETTRLAEHVRGVVQKGRHSGADALLRELHAVLPANRREGA
jgi:PAS domain S-box-containing protein